MTLGDLADVIVLARNQRVRMVSIRPFDLKERVVVVDQSGLARYGRDHAIVRVHHLEATADGITAYMHAGL